MLTNVPVDLISFCSTLGEIKPIRIRMENEAHERITADIQEILYRRQEKPSGMTILIYGCRIVLYEAERIIELHYHMDSHKWILFKVIS